MLRSVLYSAGFLLLTTTSAFAQTVPDVPPGVPTGWCCCPVARCTDGGGSGTTSKPEPSEAEKRRAREEKDSGEAADDAYDKAVEFYEKGDWGNAIKAFREVLEYRPDDKDALKGLQLAEQKRDEQKRTEQKAREARLAEAARQLKSIEAHSDKAKTEGDAEEAKKGFDTGGDPNGSITVGPPVSATSINAGDPVVPTRRRTRAIARLERQRAAVRKEAGILQETLKKLDPKKDAVRIANVKQQNNKLENEVHFLNFSISAELKKPSSAKSGKKR